MNITKQPIKAIIVDDEKNNLENIHILLTEFCPRIDVVGLAEDMNEAEELIASKKPQLAFLDIQLGADTIFTLLKKLGDINFEIIFITAHDHFAIKAFEFMAIDYLLKPVEIPKLVKAVNKAIDNILGASINSSLDQMMMQLESFNKDKHKIALSTATGYEMVYIKDIMYCIADGSYTHFCFTDKTEIMVSKNLKYYEQLLEEYDFMRTHNTTLVNLQYVKTIERSLGGAIVMEDGKHLAVSKLKRQELERSIKEKRRLI